MSGQPHALALCSLVALSCTVLTSTALAWSGLASGNPRWSGTVPYSLNEAGSPDLGGFAATEAVVREGMDDWTRVSCSALTTRYDGQTSSRPETRNTIAWIESGWPYDSNAIGVTTPRFSATEIIDAAMAMNGVNFTWTTNPGSGNQVNAYSIVLHEGGHYHGLGHSNDPSATMYFAYSGGVSALNGDDEAGICALYPGGGGGAMDCTTTGCPAGQTCDGGRCVADGGGGGTGDGLTCEGCASNGDCTDGLCLMYPDGQGYCGDRCGSDADCGGNHERCERVTDGSQRCIRRRPSDGGATCAIAPGATEPDPMPEPDPTPEPDPAAAECSSSRECGSAERCSAEGRCVPVPTGDIGDACEANADCTSGICAVDSARDETFCTAICSGDAECPAGFACVAVGGGTSACGVSGEVSGAGPGAGATPGAAPAPGTRAAGLTGGCSAAGESTNEDARPLGAVLFVALLAGLRRRVGALGR